MAAGVDITGPSSFVANLLRLNHKKYVKTTNTKIDTKNKLQLSLGTPSTVFKV